MRNIKGIFFAVMLLCAAGAWAQWVDLDVVIDATQADTYKEKAEAGDAAAQLEAGYCYDEGIGVEKDVREAFKWYTMSASQGNAQAMERLIPYYRKGQCASKDAAYADELNAKVTEANNRAREKAGQGDTEAILHLAWNMPSGDEEIVSMCMKLAESGNAKAQKIAGYLCEYGCVSPDGNTTFVEKNKPLAAGWYVKAAEQGDAYAQISVAQSYLRGTNGLERNPSKAVEWYTKASEQNEYKHFAAAALAHLGKCYMTGDEGMNRNPSVALKWLEKAAEQSSGSALITLGDYYSGMWGGEVNNENATLYYEKAVAVANWSPCTHALEKLADCYKMGWLDADEADRVMQMWFSKASLQWKLYANDLRYLKECKANWDAWQGQNNPAKLYALLIAGSNNSAFKRLSNLAGRGNAKAQYYMGKYYAELKVGEAGQKKAVKWWNKAAKQGNKQAQDALKDIEE